MTETLPTRAPHNRAMGATMRLLRWLEWPGDCANDTAIRGTAHAYNLLANHARHRCPRYGMAAQYIEAPQ
jgi:hypothetical protein